jgi:4-hydroxy-3-polyprenylbenzoate decarboxylase
MPGKIFDDLRVFIDAAKELDQVCVIEGADWNEEIGALVEAAAELIPDPPLLLFDRIKGYPPGFRVVSLPMASAKLAALALGLDFRGKSKAELRELAQKKMSNIPQIPPMEVPTGPVMENVRTGDDIDLLRFPVPRFHASDGGRYIGTGDCLVNQDPESGYINVGTFRMQVHEKNLLGLWISPGKQGRQICQRYWDRNEACPVVATFGQDLLLFMASSSFLPWGQCEFDKAGGLRGRPVEVIKGPITGLPIPAHAEIAIEGEVPPPRVEARDEGPFGEWPGYYSGGTVGTGEPQPVIRVKAIYHRDNPIIHDSAPLWPGAVKYGLNYHSGKDRLEKAGIQDVVAVGSPIQYMQVISIRQRYAGHAKQAALAAASGTYNGRWIVVVDEDIDPYDLKEVIWAMTTRCDPAKDIEIINGCWSTPLDPLVSSDPTKREPNTQTNSLAIYYAVRPIHSKDKFPKVSRAPRDLRQKIVEKYRGRLPFPPA